MKNRVMITGLGVITPIGIGVNDFWQACIKGESGIDYIKSFDTANFEVKIAGEVKNFDPAKFMLPAIYRKIDRFAQLGLAATKLAFDNSGLEINSQNESRVGVIIGSGLGGILFHEEQIIKVIQEGGPSKAMASAVPRISPNSVSSYIAIAFGIKGPNLVISTACSSGANAIGQAFTLIRHGLIDCCVVGGVEAPISPVTVAAYQALRCLSQYNDLPNNASRPFDKTRNGFVIGEGAGILILESENHARKRNAKIYSELVGYATNCGAYNMVAPQPDGVDAADAIKKALEDAELGYQQIDYINAHGTGTIYNDATETKAIKAVFGEMAYSIPVSSIKSMLGHTIGAAGAIEAVASVLTISNQTIPPTLNLNTPDPECDLDYVPHMARNKKVETVCSNSFGFGSNNAVLIFKKKI